MGPLVIASFRDSKHNGSRFTIMKIGVWPFGMTIPKLLGNLTMFSRDAASQSGVQNEKPCCEHAKYASYILVIPIAFYCHPIPENFWWIGFMRPSKSWNIYEMKSQQITSLVGFVLNIARACCTEQVGNTSLQAQIPRDLSGSGAIQLNSL